jgi:hypothetical protein
MIKIYSKTVEKSEFFLIKGHIFNDLDLSRITLSDQSLKDIAVTKA